MTKQAWDKIFQLEEEAESVLIHPRKTPLDNASRNTSENQPEHLQVPRIISADKAVTLA